MSNLATAITLGLKLLDGIAIASEAYRAHRRSQARRKAVDAADALTAAADRAGLGSEEVRVLMAESCARNRGLR